MNRRGRGGTQRRRQGRKKREAEKKSQGKLKCDCLVSPRLCRRGSGNPELSVKDKDFATEGTENTEEENRRQIHRFEEGEKRGLAFCLACRHRAAVLDSDLDWWMRKFEPCSQSRGLPSGHKKSPGQFGDPGF